MVKNIRDIEHPFAKAPPIELGQWGSLQWKQINPQQIQFAIYEGPTPRATVVCDLDQCKQLIKSLADICGVKTVYATPHGIIKP